MSFGASVKWNSGGGVVDAVARYLKIDRTPRPVMAKAADKPEGEKAPKAKPASRRARATSTTVESPKKSTRPRTEGRTERPRKRPTQKRSEQEAPKQPAPTCPDCDGEIELSWDQCPHCALFLNPGSPA